MQDLFGISTLFVGVLIVYTLFMYFGDGTPILNLGRKEDGHKEVLV